MGQDTPPCVKHSSSQPSNSALEGCLALAKGLWPILISPDTSWDTVVLHAFLVSGSVFLRLIWLYFALAVLEVFL